MEETRTVTVRILIGDVREKLQEIPAGSIHCVVTSQPYWGLRDYGTSAWEGGDPECNHEPDEEWIRRSFFGESSNQKLSDGSAKVTTQRNAARAVWFKKTPGACPRCGAIRIDRQLGLEPTPEEYLLSMTAVFREVRRVLRDDGTAWVNMGDGYASGEIGRHDTLQSEGICKGTAGVVAKRGIGKERKQMRLKTGLKPKDLVGMPWRLAFALQADGWYLRSDIIWSKPNPMPESVTDRPTKAHEYIFLLSKSAKYFYDADAVREEAEYGRREQPSNTWDRCKVDGRRVSGSTKGSDPSAGRNLRTVWTIATHAYPEAHFATFPPKLVEPCVKAGCPVGGTVLDPFGGAGTTGLVADRLGRNAILVEFNPEYAAMAKKRIFGDCPLFADVETI